MLMLGQGERSKCHANDGADYAFNLSKLLHLNIQMQILN